MRHFCALSAALYSVRGARTWSKYLVNRLGSGREMNTSFESFWVVRKCKLAGCLRSRLTCRAPGKKAALPLPRNLCCTALHGKLSTSQITFAIKVLAARLTTARAARDNRPRSLLRDSKPWIQLMSRRNNKTRKTFRRIYKRDLLTMLYEFLSTNARETL